ncbi:MAG: SCP2 sterol-binding domain-containing protein [Chloroflexota bacterium]|nr:SCP2 sterol-binding domain-containing protein [Chloroflexota bacterium]
MRIEEIMKQIPHHFNAENAAGVSGVVQLNFTGEQASDWVITIKDQKCQVEKGTTKDPDLTIKAKSKDGVKLLTGKLDAMRAYMFGKIKVFGDLTLGMKLTSFFN